MPVLPHQREQPPPVAVLVPLYKRVREMPRLIANLRETTPSAKIYARLCGDTLPVVRKGDLDGVECVYSQNNRYGPGINLLARQAREDGFPWLFVGADDLHFHEGWLEKALEKTNDKIWCVGTNDLHNPRVLAGEHATHFLVKADYLDEGTRDAPNELLCEGYLHQFVDDEFRRTAIDRGRWDMAMDSHVEHLHPVWGQAEMDETYERGMSGWDHDEALFRKRWNI